MVIARSCSLVGEPGDADIPDATVSGTAISGCGSARAARDARHGRHDVDHRRLYRRWLPLRRAKIAEASAWEDTEPTSSAVSRSGMQATVVPVFVIVFAMLGLLRARRSLRRGRRRDEHAVAGGDRRVDRRLRPDHRQRRAGSPRWPRWATRSAQCHGSPRRVRQHHQGGHQGLCHRLGGPRGSRPVRAPISRI